MAVDPYDAPLGETPQEKRERLMHLTDENWTPGSDPLMPAEPVEPEPVQPVQPDPAEPVSSPLSSSGAKSEPAPARAVRGSGDAARKS